MRLAFVFLIILCAGNALAQREIDGSNKSAFMDRIYFGGGLGFSAGTSPSYGRYTFVGLYPVVGYMVSSKMSAGTAITYQYYSYPDQNSSVTQYGISPFLRYNFGQLFAYTEFMILNSPTLDPLVPRKNYNRWLLGLGYSQPIGRRGAINAMGLYDVLYNPSQGVFPSPWVFRVFFSY